MEHSILSQLIVSAISAFLGAFFAFVFLRIADGLKAYYDRSKQNYNAMVRLEYMLNLHTNEISINIFEIDQIIEGGRLSDASGVPIVVANWPQEITIPENVSSGLLNIDLINQLMSYASSIRKLNTSFLRLNQQASEARSALLSGSVNPTTYKNSFGKTVSGAKLLKKFLLDARNEATHLLAIVNVYVKDAKPMLDRAFHLVLVKKYRRNHDAAVAKEMKNLEKQLAQVQKESQERINRALAL